MTNSISTKTIPTKTERHPKADAARQAAADRWAKNLTAQGLAAPAVEHSESWLALARGFGERKGYVPSLDTRQMIHERMAVAK